MTRGRKGFIFLLPLAALATFAASSVQAEVVTIFSDVGPAASPPFNIFTFSGSPDAFFDGHARDVVPPEGFESFKTTQTVNSYAGWSMQYGTPQNLSRFQAGGVLKFWVNSTVVNGNVQIEIKNGTGATGTDVFSQTINTLGWTSASAGQWVELSIPLSGIDLSNVWDPFVITAQGAGNLYFDNVRYVSSTATPFFNVSLHNISDGSTATGLSWGSLALPVASPWISAGQYIQVEVDSDLTSWGVQIYTDNTATDANPKFVSPVPAGSPGSNPAGLVNTASGSSVLPLAWSVHADATVPVAAEPNNVGSDPNAYQWLYMADKATPAIPSQNTAAFQNGNISYATQTNQGIHFGQSPAQIGAANPPNKIYLEADFAPATAPNTYQTSAIRVEYYSL